MNARRTIAVHLLAVAVVLLLPVIIPAGVVLGAVEDRRKLKAAASFPCVTCGALLGPAAVRLADEQWRKHVSDLRRAHPFVKFRLVRTCHATCTTCGTRYKFDDKERTFVVEAPRPFAGRA
jgi:hypothetical protein